MCIRDSTHTHTHTHNIGYYIIWIELDHDHVHSLLMKLTVKMDTNALDIRKIKKKHHKHSNGFIIINYIIFNRQCEVHITNTWRPDTK